jgi:hypothetical protein
VFESRERLAEDIRGLLEALRQEARGRYACLLEPGRILFESPEPEEREEWALRRFLEERSAALFTLPGSMAGEGPAEDLFDGWEHDDFLLAFINGRVAAAVACPDAEAARDAVMRPLRALADRLLRYNETWRLDERGRGFFLGSARLDLVVVGRTG